MSSVTDVLANLAFWSVLLISSGGAFYAGFYYTHSATANVPVKQPVPPTVSQRPERNPPPASPVATSGGLLPGPETVNLSPTQAPTATPAPADTDVFQTEAGGITEAGATEGTNLVYRVQVGAFDTREGAQRQVETLQAQGLNAVVVWDGGSYRAQLGAFTDRNRAFYVAQEINARGFAVTVRR
ncbi:MAG: SPOR domain-containing protein [Candidatus Sericytochromatia bacterium]|nr:SPOR domain-containing protein [Candidatus Sericytochromatia bacterium]